MGEILSVPLADKLYLFRLATPDAQAAVLRQPWVVNGQLLGFIPWRPEFVPMPDAIDSALLWVRLPGLPIEMWSEAILKSIFSVAGHFVFSDAATRDMKRGSFARACVRVDLRRPLRPGVRLRGQGEPFWQSFVFEHVEGLCVHCGSLHLDGPCSPAPATESAPPSGYGPWMTVTRRRKLLPPQAQAPVLPRKSPTAAGDKAKSIPASSSVPAGDGWQAPARPLRRRHFVGSSSSSAAASGFVFVGSPPEGSGPQVTSGDPTPPPLSARVPSPAPVTAPRPALLRRPPGSRSPHAAPKVSTAPSDPVPPPSQPAPSSQDPLPPPETAAPALSSQGPGLPAPPPSLDHPDDPADRVSPPVISRCSVPVAQCNVPAPAVANAKAASTLLEAPESSVPKATAESAPKVVPSYQRSGSEVLQNPFTALGSDRYSGRPKSTPDCYPGPVKRARPVEPAPLRVSPKSRKGKRSAASSRPEPHCPPDGSRAPGTPPPATSVEAPAPTGTHSHDSAVAILQQAIQLSAPSSAASCSPSAAQLGFDSAASGMEVTPSPETALEGAPDRA